MEKTINIEFVIPTYNEELNIDDLFELLFRIKKIINTSYLTKTLSWAILVADNGSTDNTIERLNSYKDKLVNFKLLSFHKNYGYAFSTSYLLHKSTGDICILIPADGQIPIDVIINGIKQSINDFRNVLFVRSPDTRSMHIGINIVNLFKRLFYFIVNRFNDDSPIGYFGMGVYLGHSLLPIRQMPRGFIPFQNRSILPKILRQYNLLTFKELDRRKGKSGFNLSNYIYEAISIIARSEYISRYGVQLIISLIFLLLLIVSSTVFLIKLLIPAAIIPGFATIILVVLTSTMLNVLSIYLFAIRIEKILLMPSNNEPIIKDI
ncbi:glycosyltransferase [Prochlorococcus sp. MIT 1223]|uniref:glycosyltransferase n=1 Tax=Prochlorococcus sp. MIT 1223 TaxID=3096217 RepID=UPI002A76061E|nr:glycosyltransferase [Prochlorococcus sp. MIT 1223]